MLSLSKNCLDGNNRENILFHHTVHKLKITTLDHKKTTSTKYTWEVDKRIFIKIYIYFLVSATIVVIKLNVYEMHKIHSVSIKCMHKLV